MTLNWGVPDWRDRAAYELERTPQQWRWEFLRRRPDYREDWLLYFNDPDCRVDPDSLCEDQADFAWGSMETRAKYGIGSMHDPSVILSSWEAWQVWLSEYGYSIRRASKERFQEMESIGKLAIVFDLNQPLSKQFAKAKAYLIHLQRERGGGAQRRSRQDLWVDYLRVIDARDAGATWETIGREVLGREDDAAQHARNAWEQAAQLRNNWPR